ncbi:MAG TPA: Holliday junction branch migration protein RuvA [Candidatus Fusicatenibacter intestinigallinarum]|uniref:Holliday junction branch migration complex subunit RuvA n=1 Tax=Candidatus Fusicatenibacter intestinigallinarum TaxID=2838598 RepID=A0A9D2N9E2_9FIRM|nr:Holliday junction branch migration protein RuvA [Candidatus Fusicatenibacter intestinigallinarum]
MIGYIKGTVAELSADRLILENGGIGYEIFVPASVLDAGIRQGQELKVYTYLHVREDALQLFGFQSRDELQTYRLLLGVSGIGPKAAIGILSAMSVDTLRFAVLSDDAAAIAKAPGIGKKTAQKLILELKDKFSLEEAFEKKLAANQQDAAEPVSEDAASEAVQALVALGYSGTEALQAVRKVEGAADMDTEAVLKAALKNLF